MMGYIDKEAYKEKYMCCGYLPEMSGEEFDAFPEADVVPVVRGRWILNKKYAKCTCCGLTRDIESQFGWNYCPKCGAKMDLEE